MAYEDIEESRLYQRVEKLVDLIWDTVMEWNEFAKDTVGKQLTRAADSVGANIAESAGRFHPGDVIRFLYYSRGSLRETRYWLKRAVRRNLVPKKFLDDLMSELNSIGFELNSYINFQKTRTVKEEQAEYLTNLDNNFPSYDLPNEPTN